MENPEQDSKKASAGFVILPVAIKGIAPNMADKSQQVVTIRNPSFTFSVFKFFSNVLSKKTPTEQDAASVMRNGIY